MSTKAKIIAIVVLVVGAMIPPDKAKEAALAVWRSYGGKAPVETVDTIDSEALLDSVLTIAAERVPDLAELTTSNRLYDYWDTMVEQAFLGNFTPSVTTRINAVWPAMRKALDIGETSNDLTGADRAAAAKVFLSFVRKPE
jgi:hypothetical protein